MAKTSKDDFMGLFWDLSNPSDDIRISAAEKIVKELKQCQEKYEKPQDSDEPWCSEVQYSLGRLFQGLASERKASRLGYSLALSHLMSQLNLNDDLHIGKILSLADEKLNQPKEKKVEKGVLLGNVFAFLSVIKSCELSSASSSMKTIFDGLLKLSKSKSYLAPSSLHGICVLIEKIPNSIFDEVMWPRLSEMLSKGWIGCDAEMFQVLQTCCKYQSETCGKTFLKTHNWIGQKSKKIELIGVHSFKHLGAMLPATTMCHPRIHPLCYEVVDRVVQCENDVFKKFWKESIEEGLLASTPEKKYLGLKLSLHITSKLTSKQIILVWSSKVVTILMYIFSNKSNPLHNVCKTEILDGLAEKMKSATHDQQLTLLFQFFTSPAGLFLDDNTNTRGIALLVGSLNLEALLKYIDWLRKVFATGKLEHDGVKEVIPETARRWSLSELSQLLRNPRLPRNDDWIMPTMQLLLALRHFTWGKKTKKVNAFENISKVAASMSVKTREHLKQCVEPALNAITTMASTSKDLKQKFHGMADDGELWVCKMIAFLNTSLTKHKVELVTPMDATSKEMWSDLVERLALLKNIQESDSSRRVEATALRSLMSHVGIRLINCPKEELNSTREVLNDLFSVVDSRFADEAKDDKETTELDWVEVIVETILSMLSQNSRAIRSVANQVFRLLSMQLTSGGLHLILKVLDPTQGDQILEGDGDESDEDMDDDDKDEDSDSDDSAFEEDDISDDSQEAENKFREQVKEALGEAAPSSDDDDDGEHAKQDLEEKSGDAEDEDSAPELDDEAMMRIDSVLAEVFRQKKLTKKKSEEDSHQQLLVFQLRCLDLLEILANRRHSPDSNECTADSLIVQAVKPLFLAIQHASKSAKDMTLAEKASVLLRVKICKMKRYPRNLSTEFIDQCHADIAEIITAAYKAHSVFICELASDCCMFLLRVLGGNKTDDSDETVGAINAESVLNVYNGVVDNYMTKGGTHLQPCIIEDFIKRFPVIAYGLAPDLLKYVKDKSLSTYRRTKACAMLQELLKNSIGRGKCSGLLHQVVSVANELLERALGGVDVKAKFYAELLKLYYHTLSILQSTDKLKSFNTSDLVVVLQKFVESSNVTKSQELTNWAWKALRTLGVNRDPSVIRKKSKKRKRTNSVSEICDDDAPTTTAAHVDNDENNVTGKESKKEIKSRVLKEKKERRKKKNDTLKQADDELKPDDKPGKPKGKKRKKLKTVENVAE